MLDIAVPVQVTDGASLWNLGRKQADFFDQDDPGSSYWVSDSFVTVIFT